MARSNAPEDHSRSSGIRGLFESLNTLHDRIGQAEQTSIDCREETADDLEEIREDLAELRALVMILGAVAVIAFIIAIIAAIRIVTS